MGKRGLYREIRYVDGIETCVYQILACVCVCMLGVAVSKMWIYVRERERLVERVQRPVWQRASSAQVHTHASSTP